MSRTILYLAILALTGCATFIRPDGSEELCRTGTLAPLYAPLPRVETSSVFDVDMTDGPWTTAAKRIGYGLTLPVSVLIIDPIAGLIDLPNTPARVYRVAKPCAP